MTSVNTRTVHNQVNSTIQNKPSEQYQEPVRISTDAQSGHPADLPDDIVSISVPPEGAGILPKNILPSTPVSNSEKSNLLNTTSGRKGFSTFA
jgi:hypothetical protein